MKILHIITRLIVGGAQENTLLTCEGQARRGHEVILLTGPSEGPEGSLMARAEAGGYQVMVTPYLTREPHPWKDWQAYKQIQRICRSLKPDVVHTHSSKAGVLGRGAAWKAGGRAGKRVVVHTIHGLPFHPYQGGIANGVWVGFERWSAKRCHGIICVADAMTRQALAAKVGRPEMYTTVYSAMEVEPFVQPGVTRSEVRERLGIPPTAYVYGTIARLQPLKGHDDLLAEFGRVLEKVPEAHLLWIGDGIYRQRFERIIEEKGWGGRVTMTGLVPPTEVPKLLPAMDVVVHPSYREGLARALPQGLLAGVPVISYDCDGAREVCVTGKTGYLVKTGDTAGLRMAMVMMADDRAKGIEMGSFGQQFCLERFSAPVMVEGIEKVYEKLAKEIGLTT